MKKATKEKKIKKDFTERKAVNEKDYETMLIEMLEKEFNNEV